MTTHLPADDLVLDAQGLSVRRGRATVLHEVSFSVRRGEVVAVLGPNGAGKSTLLECLGGLLTPSGGSVVRTGRVATVMQTPGLARRSVRANVELALRWWGRLPRSERRARALEALTLMRADHLASRPASAISGGERRRVHLARGVAVRPDVLLLDEPFAGLDPETHAALCQDATSALRASAGAVVLVVHDRTEAWAMADRVVVMMSGRIVADGTPDGVLARPPSAEVARFLGYDGTQLDGDVMTLTRPVHVVVDPAGDRAATVTRTTRRLDGMTVELTNAAGVVHAEVGQALAVGDAVRFRLEGAVQLPSSEPIRS